MNAFGAVFKNNYYRMFPRIVPMIIITAVTLVSIMLAVYITGLQQVMGHIVIVSQGVSQTLPVKSKELDISVLPKKPPRSDLIKQKYDAYITVNENGSYEVETLHDSNYKNMILMLLKNPNVNVKIKGANRGVGVNITGFMMMFLLMIVLSNLFAFADDKEQGQLHRIAVSPASFIGYLSAHCAYCLSLLVPEFLMLAVLKWCGWDIGFSLPQYAGLIIVLGLLGISFGLLLNTFIKKPDNANMLGNAVTVLMTVLAGGFYSFSKSNPVLDRLIGLLPQKEIINFAQSIQNGTTLQNCGQLIYVIMFSLLLFAVSCGVLKRMYVKKV